MNISKSSPSPTSWRDFDHAARLVHVPFPCTVRRFSNWAEQILDNDYDCLEDNSGEMPHDESTYR